MKARLDPKWKYCFYLSFAQGGLFLLVLLPALVFFLSVADAMGDGQIDPRKGLIGVVSIAALGGLLLLSGFLMRAERWRRWGAGIGFPTQLIVASLAIKVSLARVLFWRSFYWGDLVGFALALVSLLAAGILLRGLLRRENPAA